MPKCPIPPEGVIILEVDLIGKSRVIPLKMVLDTGASMTTIPKEAAMAIGIDPTKSKRRIEMITASSTEYAPVVIIPKIKFLGLELKNIEAVCHNLPSQASISGLLGLNVLRNFNIWIKFLTRLLEITK
jgi:clan AA aspartic protease (TIGR02281 family)